MAVGGSLIDCCGLDVGLAGGCSGFAGCIGVGAGGGGFGGSPGGDGLVESPPGREVACPFK